MTIDLLGLFWGRTQHKHPSSCCHSTLQEINALLSSDVRKLTNVLEYTGTNIQRFARRSGIIRQRYELVGILNPFFEAAALTKGGQSCDYDHTFSELGIDHSCLRDVKRRLESLQLCVVLSVGQLGLT